jgi:hypothetical protein
MSKPELLEIIENGLDRCATEVPAHPLEIEAAAKERIADYSYGLPNYTHLLAGLAAMQAVREDRARIGMGDLEHAIREAVEGELESVMTDYNQAVAAPRGTNFKQVLLACALARKNEQRLFFASDVVAPLSEIAKRAYAVPAFARHLKEFCQPSHGPVLERRGPTRRIQYRFVDTLLEPYVILRGLAEGVISESQLTHPSSDARQLWLLPPAPESPGGPA